MAFPQAHLLLRFNGHFGTAGTIVDSWSVGMRFGILGQEPVYDVAKLQTFVNAAQTAANTFHANATTNAGTATYLDYVSGARISVLGRYDPTNQVTVVSPTTITAGAGTNSLLPWNTASVLSLRTTNQRGVASNGRVYWPACGLVITPATGRVIGGNMTNRIGGAKTFLDALNVAAGNYAIGLRLMVFSAKGGGAAAAVTSVRSDDRLDSIERRENKQPSQWTSASLA